MDHHSKSRNVKTNDVCVCACVCVCVCVCVWVWVSHSVRTSKISTGNILKLCDISVCDVAGLPLQHMGDHVRQ